MYYQTTIEHEGRAYRVSADVQHVVQDEVFFNSWHWNADGSPIEVNPVGMPPAVLFTILEEIIFLYACGCYDKSKSDTTRMRGVL